MKSLYLSAEEVGKFLSYCPESGLLTWLVSPNGRITVGQVAGNVSQQGYINIQLLGRQLKAHRVAWLLHYGEWPENEVDHTDGDRANNRIANLRAATHSQNMQNKFRAKKGSTSGYIGVSWSEQSKAWHAQIRAEGKVKHLGFFATPEEASQAYLVAKARYHHFWAGHTEGERAVA
ncbi:HNH endonuclease [Arenimonas alkanexedens]